MAKINSTPARKLIIIIVIIIGFSLALTLFIYKSNSHRPSISTMNSRTEDWKTYSNSDLGFSVQYPNDFNVQQSKNGLNESIVFDSLDYQLGGKDVRYIQTGGQFKVTSKKGNITDFKEQAKDYYNTVEEITLNGQPAIKYYNCIENSDGVCYALEHRGLIYTISYFQPNKEIYKNYEDKYLNEFNTFLSTFKFTN